MFRLSTFATALVAGLIGSTLAAPIVPVTPGTAKDIIITKQDTVNATNPAPANSTVQHQILATEYLPLNLYNNFEGGAINAYVTGLDVNNQLVMLQPNGQFYYPTADSSATTPQPIDANVAIPLGPQGSLTSITLPGYISAARVWFAEGDLQFFTVYTSANGGPSLVEPSAVNPSDPSANVNWGFVEITNTEGGLYANISYVDFVGLILGMKMLAGDGTVQTAEGLRRNSVNSICSSLVAQGQSDGQPWGDLCMAGEDGNVLRVIAPSDYVASNPSAFSDYWTDYVNQVYSYYTTNTLTINTQAAAGMVACTVQNNELTCEGDNRGYPMPNAGDIFGCNSGPFGILPGDNDIHLAVVPRLCAAFNRGTLMMSGGNVQPGLPASSYYGTPPSNWYSYFVHEHEIDGQGYAFSYDDVNPSGENQSGVLSDTSPQHLKVIVGGPLTS